MMFSISLALFSIVGTAFGAVIATREDNPVPPGFCCFHLLALNGNNYLQRDARTGDIFINDPNLPRGWYCIDQVNNSKVLYDRDNNACILTSPRNSFECLDGTPGGDTWTLVPSVFGAPLLQDYGSIDFNVCNVNGRQQIYGPSPGGLSCQGTQLLAYDRIGQCK